MYAFTSPFSFQFHVTVSMWSLLLKYLQAFDTRRFEVDKHVYEVIILLCQKQLGENQQR